MSRERRGKRVQTRVRTAASAETDHELLVSGRLRNRRIDSTVTGPDHPTTRLQLQLTKLVGEEGEHSHPHIGRHCRLRPTSIHVPICLFPVSSHHPANILRRRRRRYPTVFPPHVPPELDAIADHGTAPLTAHPRTTPTPFSLESRLVAKGRPSALLAYVLPHHPLPTAYDGLYFDAGYQRNARPRV